MIIKYEATIDIEIETDRIEEEMQAYKELIDFNISKRLLGTNEILLDSKISR